MSYLSLVETVIQKSLEFFYWQILYLIGALEFVLKMPCTRIN